MAAQLIVRPQYNVARGILTVIYPREPGKLRVHVNANSLW